VGTLKGTFLSEQGDSGKDNQFTDPDVKLGSPEPRAALLAEASVATHRPTCLLVWTCVQLHVVCVYGLR